MLKLEINNKVRNKAIIFCKNADKKEWSGILFYKIKQDNKDIIFKTIDLLLMDIGSSTYTEYEENENVAEYILYNDLHDCHIGLMHSHNYMNTFFSGTDTNTLIKKAQQGFENGMFLSVITNIHQSYNAKVSLLSKSNYEYNGIQITTANPIILDINEIKVEPLIAEKEKEQYDKEFFNLYATKVKDNVKDNLKNKQTTLFSSDLDEDNIDDNLFFSSANNILTNKKKKTNGKRK